MPFRFATVEKSCAQYFIDNLATECHFKWKKIIKIYDSHSFGAGIIMKGSEVG